MKPKFLFTVALLILGLSLQSKAQGFLPPSEGKAVIYFARISNFAFGVEISFFDNDEYLGTFKKRNYFRYECDPGNKIIWASANNKIFVQSELKANSIYIVKVDAFPDGWTGGCNLDPKDYNLEANSEELAEVVKLVNEKEPITFKPSDLVKKKDKRDKFIIEQLARYNEEFSDIETPRRIKPEWAISMDKLNQK